jgi:hypothetical protein
MRASAQRLELLKDRTEIDLMDLALAIAAEHSDVDKVKSELLVLAKVLRIPVGKLRPDDVVEELAGRDFFVGDALLEIEVRLQKCCIKEKMTGKLTVSDVIVCLSK